MPALVALAAFVAMEPATAMTHRFVMHGIGLRLHRSHHRSTDHGWELNDTFPIAIAGLVCLGMWVGFHEPRLAGLVPIAVGVTAYGIAYAVVHDVYIHRRLRWFARRHVAVLDHLAAAHALHHRFGGAPYGMLVPIVPGRVRQRASGSRPFQVPELA